MALWEHEALVSSEGHIEADRAERVGKLDAQRRAELAEAKLREEQWRVEDEARAAREEQARVASLQEREAEAEATKASNEREKAAREAAMAEEQARLAEEMERVKLAKAAKEVKSVVVKDDFSYEFEAGMEGKIKTFRQRGSGGDAIIMKIDHESNEIRIEEQIKGCPSLEELGEKLDETEPRYLLYIHKVAHRDGRVQYPIAFIVFLPDHLPVHLKVMYTRPITTLTEQFKVNKHLPLEDVEDLEEEWLEKMLGIEKK